MGSAQVSWWSVHQYVTAVLERIGPYPMAGTPAWCALPDDDPAKIAALLDAAQHWALRMEIGQQQFAEASRDVSGAADWSAIANESSRRREVYIPRVVA